MARLSIQLLGPFQATLDGRPVTDFESDRVRALLAYLAVEVDRPHRRERLAGLLWPDWPDRSALTNLRNALSNLRKAIGDRQAAVPVLLIDRKTIQFNLASDCTVDTHLFKSFLASGQTAPCIEKGIALVRGPFLEGFGLKDSSAFEEWSVVVREQLQRQTLEALEQLAEQYEARGDLVKARESAWRQIELAPWREGAHRRLMRLLAFSGERDAAMAQFETCRQTLKSELSVAPSPETVALYEDIRDGKYTGRRAPSTTGIPPLSSIRPANLPVWLTSFVDCEELLTEIITRLKAPSCRLLTLAGPGGSGKTRLAVEAVSRFTAESPLNVCFVSLAALQSPENLVPAIAQALGFSFSEQEEPLAQLLHFIHKKSVVLVLDNFEHLLNDPEMERESSIEVVTRLLEAAPGIKVLITSRMSLNVQGEYLLPVPGMKYPPFGQSLAPAPDALEYSAVQLFVQEAGRVRSGFEPSKNDLTHVIQICRLVQGMPLGILLAAAWMRILSPAEIATQLAAHKLDFLEADWANLPERQRSMRLVFDYSWRLLSERERQVLMALSVFRDGFAFAAAHQVDVVEDSATSLKDLMDLVNSSMLQRTQSGRYVIHELLRQYAEERLRKSPDGGETVYDRHSAYFTTALRQWVIELEGPRQTEALTEFDVENGNVRAAWAWAVNHDQVNRLADGMKGVGAFCDWRARYKEGEKAFRTMADRLDAKGPLQTADQLKLRASALAWQARFNQRLGRIELARALAQQSQALLGEPMSSGLDVRWECALARQVIGEIEVQFGNCQDGKAPLSQSLSLYREVNDRRSIANCLRSLGRLYERMGDYIQAVELHRESVEICRSMQAKRDTVDALLDLFVDLRCLGQGEESDRLLRESVEIAEQLGDAATLTAVQYRKGTVLVETQPLEGLALLEGCVAAYDELGDRHRWALAQMRVGDAHMHLGQYDQARAPLQASLDWYREVDNWWGIGAALRLMAELALIQDRQAEAWPLLEESATAFRKSGARSDVGWTLASMGIAAAVLDDRERARQYLADAMHIALKFRHQFMPQYVLMGQAILAAKEGQAERALWFWLLLSPMSHATPSRLYQDLYNKYIAPVVSSLSPAARAAAIERVQTKDVWTALEELVAELRG